MVIPERGGKMKVVQAALGLCSYQSIILRLQYVTSEHRNNLANNLSDKSLQADGQVSK